MYPAAYFVTFRVRLSRQGKARSAVNGDTLYKERNAALAAQAHSLRAGRKEAIRGVMPLANGGAIPGEACLAASLFPAR